MRKIIKKESLKLRRAFSNPTFIYLAVVGNAILLFCTLVVYFLEKNVNPHLKTYFDSLWWGVNTITTVGFGDVVPITSAGRFIGIFLMYTGTVLFVTFTGLLVTTWTREEFEKEIAPIEEEVRQEEKEQKHIELMLRKMSDRLEKLESKLK